MTRAGQLLAALGFLALGFAPSPPPAKLYVLAVGGGPEPKHNQVAIESNVRYFDRAKPTTADLRVLFTSGDKNEENVLCLDDKGKEYYRKPDLPRLDGPAHLETVKTELANLAEKVKQNPSSGAFLYFTGHGSPNRAGNLNNNHFDLWDKQRLTVTDLAAALASFPKQQPVTLLMVECYSGSFGNVLFEGGLPDAPLAEGKVCGFFASVQQRMAAGCTPNVNEAEYRDFTGYFLAALTGKDRLGRDAGGADYDKNGRIGMDEAFAYCLLNDNSIDTPVCTSDVFLRRFVTTADEQIMATPFSEVRKWARPAQLVALDGLSSALKLEGEDRLQTAYKTFRGNPVDADKMPAVHAIRFVRLAKTIVLQHQLAETGAPDIKRRFADLLKLEAANPLRN
ncbi:MAG: hypothetical protein JSS65_08845 [Armatimonadetes bacterium]|nr:hypothetical protein [Armatimonadota bacterium]